MKYYIFKFLIQWGPKIYLWLFIFFNILIKMYLACNVKKSLKKIFVNQFQTYVLFTFIIHKF